MHLTKGGWETHCVVHVQYDSPISILQAQETTCGATQHTEKEEALVGTTEEILDRLELSAGDKTVRTERIQVRVRARPTFMYSSRSCPPSTGGVKCSERKMICKGDASQSRL